MDFLKSFCLILFPIILLLLSGLGIRKCVAHFFQKQSGETRLTSLDAVSALAVLVFIMLTTNQLFGAGKIASLLAVSFFSFIGSAQLLNSIRKLGSRKTKEKSEHIRSLLSPFLWISVSIIIVLLRLPTDSFSLATVQLKYGSDATSYMQAAQWILSGDAIPQQSYNSTILELKSSVLLQNDQRSFTFGVAAFLTQFSPASLAFSYTFVISILLCMLLIAGVEASTTLRSKLVSTALLALTPFFELAFMGYLAKIVFAIYLSYFLILIYRRKNYSGSEAIFYSSVFGVSLATSWNPQPFLAVSGFLMCAIIFSLLFGKIIRTVKRDYEEFFISDWKYVVTKNTFVMVASGIVSWGISRNLDLNTRLSGQLAKEVGRNYNFIERFTTLLGSNWYGDPQFFPNKVILPIFFSSLLLISFFLLLTILALAKDSNADFYTALLVLIFLLLMLATSISKDHVRVAIQFSGFPWQIIALFGPPLVYETGWKRLKSNYRVFSRTNVKVLLFLSLAVLSVLPKTAIVSIPFYKFDDVQMYRYSEENLQSINKCTRSQDILIGQSFGSAEAEFLYLPFARLNQRVGVDKTSLRGIANWYIDQKNVDQYFPRDLSQNANIRLERELKPKEGLICRAGILSVYLNTK